MKRLAWIVSLAGIFFCPAVHGQKPLRGFSASGAAAELKLETRMDRGGSLPDHR